MKVILTNLPSFYKINLYNEINKEESVFVIYTNDGRNLRNADFFAGVSQFRSIQLPMNRYVRYFTLIKILLTTHYQELIIGGWDSGLMWIGALISSKKKNSAVVESSDYESKTTGLKKLLKKIFLSRISKIYASGIAQKRLVEKIGFKRQIIITRGVGIFNYIPQPSYTAREKVQNFLYVGRLSPEKNLSLLISVFRDLPDKTLLIIGFGPQESGLRKVAPPNVMFLGAIDNKQLYQYYQNADVFVLPSLSEPWGLVVEEALNNGLPVIVSDRVGCAEEIVVEGKNGLIFQSGNRQSLMECIDSISNIHLYNHMRKEISLLDFETIEKQQVLCYLS